ncbi:tail fiber protein [Rodentibacter abscessus]|uniref:tail fiber protein n=1 Tax=Rodentibacter abscessus TaxID=3381777 RepID=UPI00399D2F0A
MANLKEQEKWEDGIYQIEENDPVLGGEDGITNKPAKQLANRTFWLKKALEALTGKSKPKDLTADSTSNADKDGHSHALPKSSTSQKGIVQLDDTWESDSREKAPTARVIKTMKGLIDSLTRNLNNYIPNSKKSNATNSNSSDTVATSLAVKNAFDKGQTALTAANNAQSAANAANNNANGRVSKSGDTMTGTLTVPYIIVNDAGNNNNSVQVGDDAKFLDVDIGNTIGLQGIGAPTKGYIAYGTSKKRFGFDGTLFRAESAIGTNHYGHGSYASQYSTNAPFMVEANGSVSRDTYHPFIKGKVRAAGQYGTAFSLGYTTKQGSGDGFGRGIIHLIEDNGAEKYWGFEHNGDFRSSNDVITGSGNSLNALQNNYTQFVGSNSYIKSLTNNNIQLRWKPSGNRLELKVDNTELGGIYFSNLAYIDATAENYGGLRINRPSNNDQMLMESNGNRFAFIRRNKQSGSNHYVIYTPEKSGTVALLEDIRNVVRRNYNRTIKGTNPHWDSGTQKNIAVTGYTVVFPDGRIEQYFYFRNFRINWFSEEQARGGHHRIPEIPFQLWTAMPNKIEWVEGHISRTNDTNIWSERTVGSEGAEWMKPIWAFEKQGTIKDRLSVYARRIAGDTGETVDMYIKVVGY